MIREKHIKGYNFLKIVLGFIFNICYRPKYYNKELIPSNGPIIIAGNHMHLFDQNLVILSTKRMVHYMAKIEYFQDRRKAWFFRMAGCIPVNREIKDEDAKSSAMEVLNNGYALGVFPEGTRNKTDAFLLPFKFGVVSMAQKSGASIIPCAVTGEYKVWKKNHLNIIFGKSFKVPKDMDLKKANEKLFEEISNLKKEGLKRIKNEKH
ncbi:MAG: lysophospholipid acyltransferase family protein [Bacilli bacterium]|nr:lysophospholipid acyltransferase family protein [Bacilli bacterium]